MHDDAAILETTFEARWAVMKNKWLGLFLLVLMAGCSEQEQVETYTNTNDDKLQSEIAQLFKDDDQIEHANILLVDNEIFVALQLKPFAKWKKQKIEEKWQKKLKSNLKKKPCLYRQILSCIGNPRNC